MDEESSVDKNFSINELTTYVSFQLDVFFPDKKIYIDDLKLCVVDALDRTLFSIKHVKLNGYARFSYLHSDLYAQFIYYLSNTVWLKTQNKNLATKLFYLNKALHSFNCMYDTKLPDIFLLIHCVGTVLGKAEYADYFVACQNVTVGSDKGESPQITGPLYMGPGSSIIGKSIIAPFTNLTVGCNLLNETTPANSVVINTAKGIEYKQSKRNLIKEVYFNYNTI
ncbi:hypothetical protein [Mucilaginibacter sp. UYCu711]|uniref:hypothetical protein n=1 Tax=Mucilaginibacter sp. UYCu711 TaxID=3156339 RepID=UPI003D1FEE8F